MEEDFSNFEDEQELHEDLEPIVSKPVESETERAEKIKRIHELRRLTDEQLIRKNLLMVKLANVYNNGFGQTDEHTKTGTKEELNASYEELLKEFKIKKESCMKQLAEVREELDEKTKSLEIKKQKYTELAENQYKLEYKNAVKMIDDRTSKKLSHEEVEKMINSCKKQDIEISKVHLKLITEQNQCKHLKDEIKNRTSVYAEECNKIQKKNDALKALISNLEDKMSKYNDVINKSLNTDYSQKVKDLTEKENKLKDTLQELKDVWSHHVNMKLNEKRKNRK